MADRFPFRGTEWPTLALIAATYAVWALGTGWLYGAAPVLGWIATVLAVAQFSSLQHEALHGHPFRNRLLNEALVFPALTVFVPYRRFRETHIAHHRDPLLTDPYDDPESNYLDPAVWSRLSRPARRLLRLNNTLLGRIVLGPAIGTVVFLRDDWRKVRAGNRAIARAWLLHGVGLMLVLAWLWRVGQMPLWAYLLAAYAAYGLLKIRTFLEHRAHEAAPQRTVIIEDRGPLAVLFLFNNLHVVHHMYPGVPWYRLPRLYAEGRARFLEVNGGYVYRSYGEIFRRHLLRAKDPVPHPFYRSAR
ncbi:fatty acid desaturase [Acidimangrovimonas pyrenivorans]|uniref:Fatty acid desaturase n=1 Tax=Acidimangrovimonas pyrenivorans TaxID=2030798 RepID=A0ABV7AL81_9RHOB